MPLFEVAIIRPAVTASFASAVESNEKLIMQPEYIMAKDANTAAMKAVAGFQDGGDESIDLDRDQVIVRPFA